MHTVVLAAGHMSHATANFAAWAVVAVIVAALVAGLLKLLGLGK
jgi:hypothetical protein